MKLVEKYDAKQLQNPEEASKKIRSCMLSQPKKKKAKKNQQEEPLTHPYSLCTVETTVVQPLKAGNVQVTQKPFSAPKARPVRQTDGQPLPGWDANEGSESTTLPPLDRDSHVTEFDNENPPLEE